MSRAKPTSLAALGDTLGRNFRLVSVGWTEPDKSRDVFVVNLEPGDYVMVCLLPLNSPGLIEQYFGGEELDVDRHSDAGMFAEFSVT